MTPGCTSFPKFVLFITFIQQMPYTGGTTYGHETIAKQVRMGSSLRGFAHAAVPAGITLNGLSCVVTTTMSIL